MAALAIGNQYLRTRDFQKFEILVKQLDCYKDSKGNLFETMREASNQKDQEFLSLVAVVDEDLQNRSIISRSANPTERTQSSMFQTEINISGFFSRATDHPEEIISLRTTTQASDSLQQNPISLANSKPTFSPNLNFLNRVLPIVEPNKELASVLAEHCKVH